MNQMHIGPDSEKEINVSGFCLTQMIKLSASVFAHVLRTKDEGITV